ncbi:MAG: hypothetical protein HKN85_13180, partial [Gammaproteobacteria bacterium]|nr:hypothetical protein [Gammaproteobacteria bacterium]
MPLSLQMIILILLLPGLTACQDSGSENAGSAAKPSSSSVALFDKEMRKKGCELLSAELVSQTFDVPADVLKQTKIMGCRYDWKDDQQTVQSGISMIRVYENQAAAAEWFATATRNKTAEEMQAEMDQISRQMDQSEELNTELKKSAAKSLLAMVDS